MRVLVTRPAEDAAPFMDALAARGDDAIWSPALLMKYVEGPRIRLDGYRAVAITSANAVRALAGRTPDRQAQLFCVGPASAAAARAKGFASVRHASGEGVAALIEAISAALEPGAQPILYPSAADIAGNLTSGLAARGFKVERAIVYRMELADRLSPEAESALRGRTVAAATYFSARSAEGTRRAAEASGAMDGLANTCAVCISEAVAVAAGQWHKRTLTAAAPNEDGMLQTLDLARRSGL